MEAGFGEGSESRTRLSCCRSGSDPRHVDDDHREVVEIKSVSRGPGIAVQGEPEFDVLVDVIGGDDLLLYPVVSDAVVNGLPGRLVRAVPDEYTCLQGECN